MEYKRSLKAITIFLKKYRYVVLVLIIGLAFMFLPGKNHTTEQSVTPEQMPTEKEIELEESLGKALSQIQGAGEVQVLTTIACGAETVYQTDTQTVESNDGVTRHTETVVLSAGSGAQNALIRQTNPPKYYGVVVICQGADSPTVRLAIVDAISKLTGLGADRISVLKMK